MRSLEAFICDGNQQVIAIMRKRKRNVLQISISVLGERVKFRIKACIYYIKIRL